MKLQEGSLSEGTRRKLLDLAKALEARNFSLANRLHLEMSSESDFDKNRKWLFGVKMLLPRQ